MRQIPDIRSNQYLGIAVLGLISLSFLNMLYCILAYEFEGEPKTYLLGPSDRFADLVKLSLSYRSVTEGVDRTKAFQVWQPIYQQYYERPDYGGIRQLERGELTHFHHPPLSTLIFLFCGLFIVRTGSPSLALLLFFSIYLIEVWGLLRIGIPRADRTRKLTLTIWFFCLASYPALVIFSRANYVNAGLTTLPVVIFLTAAFAKKRADLGSLLALAIGVNIHPNAAIFLTALPLALGIRKAVKPFVQFAAISAALFAISLWAAHRLYPDYTLERFFEGVAVYGKIYITNGAGLGFGSSLFGLISRLNSTLSLGMTLSTEMATFYVLSFVIVVVVCGAYRAAVVRGRKPNFIEAKSHPVSALSDWPQPLAPFFLTSFYCVLSPVFVDYHLLVFLAPLILACLNQAQSTGYRRQSIAVVMFTSVFMLSPKNYWFLQLLLNPLVLCGALCWLAISLAMNARQSANTLVALGAADGR